MKGFFKRLSDIWNIAGVTLLLLILVEVFFRIYGSFSSDEDPRIQADCYHDDAWVPAYYQEFSKANASEWSPYVYWQREPFDGKYIKVDRNGFRVTTTKRNPLVDEGEDKILFFFGGSTMWGTGVRDNHTIPSLVGEELVKTGAKPNITNFGETGYVSSQEVSRLMLELRNGNVPDVVVFYDGVNDVFSSFQAGKAGIPQNESNRSKEFNTLKEKKKALWVFVQSLSTLATVKFLRDQFSKDNLPEYNHAVGLESLSEETVKAYTENIRLVNALAKQYGFQAFFYWQPTVFDKNHLTDYEQAEKDKVSALGEFYEAVGNKLFKDALHHEHIHFVNLSQLLKDYREPLFIDWCHLGEDGNILIALQMVGNIAPILDSAGSTSSSSPADE